MVVMRYEILNEDDHYIIWDNELNLKSKFRHYHNEKLIINHHFVSESDLSHLIKDVEYMNKKRS